MKMKSYVSPILSLAHQIRIPDILPAGKIIIFIQAVKCNLYIGCINGSHVDGSYVTSL